MGCYRRWERDVGWERDDGGREMLRWERDVGWERDVKVWREM